MDSEVLVTKMTQEQLNKILQQHKLWLDTKGEEGKRANLMGADLRYTNLRNANLIGADLRFANLRGANLVHADLRDANLEVADLEGTNLSGANLKGIDLTGVILHKAILRNADLRGVILKDAHLRGADLRGANLEGTGVYFFKGPIHSCIYNSKDDKLYIGCQVHNLEHWLKNYVAIGKEHKYTDEEIEVYGTWFKSLKELL